MMMKFLAITCVFFGHLFGRYVEPLNPAIYWCSNVIAFSTLFALTISIFLGKYGTGYFNLTRKQIEEIEESVIRHVGYITIVIIIVMIVCFFFFPGDGGGTAPAPDSSRSGSTEINTQQEDNRVVEEEEDKEVGRNSSFENLRNRFVPSLVVFNVIVILHVMGILNISLIIWD